MGKILLAIAIISSVGQVLAVTPQYQPGQVKNLESPYYQPQQQSFNNQSTWKQPQVQQWAKPVEKGVVPQYRPGQVKNSESQVKTQPQIQVDKKYVRQDTGKTLTEKDYVFRPLKNNSDDEAIAFKKGEKVEESPLTKKKQAWQTR